MPRLRRYGGFIFHFRGFLKDNNAAFTGRRRRRFFLRELWEHRVLIGNIISMIIKIKIIIIFHNYNIFFNNVAW